MPRKRILIIEDTDTLRRTEAALLRERGHEVLELDNGQQGFEAVETFKPDVVVTDCMLPGKTGFDVCLEIKEDPAHSNVRVLITTSITQGTDQDDSHWRDKVKADDFMSKPFSSDEFVKRVEALLV